MGLSPLLTYGESKDCPELVGKGPFLGLSAIIHDHELAIGEILLLEREQPDRPNTHTVVACRPRPLSRDGGDSQTPKGRQPQRHPLPSLGIVASDKTKLALSL